MGYYDSLKEEIDLIRFSEIEKKSTKELISKLQSLRKTAKELNEIKHLNKFEKQLKEGVEEYRKNIKKVLSTREHIPNKKESKLIRKERIKRNKEGRNKNK